MPAIYITSNGIIQVMQISKKLPGQVVFVGLKKERQLAAHNQKQISSKVQCDPRKINK